MRPALRVGLAALVLVAACAPAITASPTALGPRAWQEIVAGFEATWRAGDTLPTAVVGARSFVEIVPEAGDRRPYVRTETDPPERAQAFHLLTASDWVAVNLYVAADHVCAPGRDFETRKAVGRAWLTWWNGVSGWDVPGNCGARQTIEDHLGEKLP